MTIKKEELVKLLEESVNSLEGIKNNIKHDYYTDIEDNELEAKKSAMSDIEAHVDYLKAKAMQILGV